MSFEIYLFGSITRGEISPSSDVDILVVPTSDFESHSFPSGWSIYSRETIRDYFISGRLFAWHLHLHAMPVYCSSGKAWLDSLGRPNPYQTCREDILDLRDLLEHSIKEIRNDSPNLVYEFGLVYTALRDIAMSASQRLTGQHNFSRYAPYQMPDICPLGRPLYEVTMAARHASTRGASAPVLDNALRDELLECDLESWVNSILNSI